MKASYLRKLFYRYMADNLQDFSLHGHMIYNSNFEWILRGFSFEDSAFETNAFNINVFIQPLFIPKEYLSFSFGNRLGSLSEKGVDRWWSISSENESMIMQEVMSLIVGPGLRFIKKVNTPQDLIREFSNRENKQFLDVHRLEVLAYSEILIGDYKKALPSLRNLLSVLDKEIIRNPYAKWLDDTKKRVSIMNKFVVDKDFEAAYQQLLSWKEYTKNELRLKSS